MTLRRKLLWLSVLYLASGLPYGVAREVWPVYFRAHGVSLTEIGLLSLLFLPWSWKPLWAPLVDRLGSRQRWIAGCLVALAVSTLALLAVGPRAPVYLLWPVLLGFTFAAATQDIAIDAYAVDVSTERHSGPINSVRVAAYRAALVTFGGALTVIAGSFGWRFAWLTLVLCCLALAVLVTLSPRVPLDRSARGRTWRPLLAWLRRREMIPVLLFVPIYKLGDATVSHMNKVFWQDRGLSLAEIGTISTSLGMALSIAGAVAGGWFVNRRGVWSALLWLGLAQAVSNLGYWAAAVFDPPRWGYYGSALLESFCQGLGTAAFLSFLMALCRREHAATQFALLSALFAFSRDLSGAISGFAADTLGYAAFFALSTALAVPGLALLPWLRGAAAGELTGSPAEDGTPSTPD